MVYINSVSDVKNEGKKISSDVSIAMTPKALNILSKRAKNLVRDASQQGYKSNIKKSARKEYKAISKKIQKRRKQIN